MKTGSSYNSGTAYLKIGYSSSYTVPYYMSGMRFENIDIPQGTGSRITNARLRIIAYNTYLTASVFGRIAAHDADDSPAFTSSPYLGDRTRTTNALQQ